MHDVVALLEDASARHLLTDKSLLLRRGQVGTIVMSYDSTTFEVEFAGRDGESDVVKRYRIFVVYFCDIVEIYHSSILSQVLLK